MFNPSTGQVQARVAFSTPADLDRAVALAAAAQPGWAATNPQRRSRVMFRFRDLLEANMQDLAELPGVLDAAMGRKGPFLLEIDMRAIGGFKTNFAGPPVNKMDQVPASPAA